MEISLVVRNHLSSCFSRSKQRDHSMKFRQVKMGFMKKFEGCWKVDPVFIDEKICSPFKPKTWEQYCACTKGKGRVGSIVSLDQPIQPAIAPPPPVSWVS